MAKWYQLKTGGEQSETRRWVDLDRVCLVTMTVEYGEAPKNSQGYLVGERPETNRSLKLRIDGEPILVTSENAIKEILALLNLPDGPEPPSSPPTSRD